MALGERIVRRIKARIYSPHVGYEFPAEMLLPQGNEATAPVGYEIRQPPHPGDGPAIAALLSQEPGYGDWTVERLQDELLSKLAHPKAATLALFNGIPVAAGFAVDASTPRKRIAHAMYLYVVPAHRGKGALAFYIVHSTLRYCIEAGYQQVMGFTDPTRLSALLLYLSHGARPVKQSLSCHWHWRKILRRLGPALRRSARLRAQAGKKAVLF
jgi:GNAT superfamily N-acetyltransferase